MKAIIVLAACLTSTNLIGQDRSIRPSRFEQQFMMQEAEDGKQRKDTFEIWTVSGDFNNTRDSTCTIQATSLTSAGEQTHIFNWLHRARKITEVRPGIFKVEMSERLTPFSGLDVVLEFSSDGRKIVDISASMRTGSKGQSIRIYHVDRDSWDRKVPPVYNPSRKLR